MPTLSAESEPAAAVSGASRDNRISAIVPARDEEMTIEACVRSLARQAEIEEIFVVNDHSTDRTPEIVQGLTKEIPKLRLLEVRQIPAGWLGKNYAVWEGAKRATSRWLLFTDADAELLDDAAARALQIAEETGAVLVSFSPEQITQAWYEKALIPFVYCRLAKYFSYDAVNDPATKTAAANGQFLMIREDVYHEIGEHESVAGHVLEDVALAKRVKAARYRIWFGPGPEAVRVRMYRSFDDMCEGWKKNLYLLVGGTPGAVVRELVLVVPWITLALLIVGLKAPVALVGVLGLLLARQALYGSALFRNHFRVMYILYYIPAVVLYAGVLWASYRAYSRGAVEWKGRRIVVKAAE